MFHKTRTTLSITALTFFLVACGFQLRGSASIPSELHQMSLNCSNELSKVLCKTITKQLELNEVNLIASSVADYTLSVTKLNSKRRAVSITSSAVVAEYEVTNTATFNLVAADKTIIIDDTSVSSSQTYRYDENSVISKAREEEQLKEQLNKQLASKIVSRLSPYNKPRIERIKAEQATNQQ